MRKNNNLVPVHVVVIYFIIFFSFEILCDHVPVHDTLKRNPLRVLFFLTTKKLLRHTVWCSAPDETVEQVAP